MFDNRFCTDPLAFAPQGDAHDVIHGKDFDAYSEWLSGLLAEDPDFTVTESCMDSGATGIPEAGKTVAGAYDSICETVIVEQERVCLNCGAETIRDVLCLSCLERIEDIPADIACPLYFEPAGCAVKLGRSGGGLLRSGCEGILAWCEQVRALGELQDDDDGEEE